MLQLAESEYLNVLFVEDDIDHFTYFSHLLSQIDTKVITDRSVSLERARELLATKSFDLVLLDIGLPDSIGLDTVKNIVGQTECPVVVLSACDDPYLAREAVRLGAQDFLVKSEVTVHSLTRAAQYAVDRVDLLKAASQSKQFSNEFLRTVSHDLRAPLARLAQLTEILREDFGEAFADKEALKIMEGIEVESKYLAQFIQHLYSFCKEDDSRRALQLEPISLLIPLVRTLEVLGAQIDSLGARICVGRMPVLHIDNTLLAHVFQNLIGNALKYSGGRRPKITIEAVSHPAKCVVTVSDNGLGVSEEELDRVFEPFYRSQSAAVLDGNGVGLAFCKKVITCHGGRIWASASKSGGCIISFTLPLEQYSSRDMV